LKQEAVRAPPGRLGRERVGENQPCPFKPYTDTVDQNGNRVDENQPILKSPSASSLTTTCMMQDLTPFISYNPKGIRVWMRALPECVHRPLADLSHLAFFGDSDYVFHDAVPFVGVGVVVV
jgi:hypothetical protein